MPRVFGAIYFVIDLPLSFYSGFTLPHRFGQSNQTLRGWVIDQIKGLAVGGVIGVLLLEVIYAVLRAFPDTWWIWAAAILLVFSVLLANLAPVLLLPLFNKFVPLSEEYNDLAERLMRLGERAGTKVQGVYQFDMSQRTKSANAALTGLGSTRRIILGDTLLTQFTPDEIETVMAHELGHHVNRDIPYSIARPNRFNRGGPVPGLAGPRVGRGLVWLPGRVGYRRPAAVHDRDRPVRAGDHAADQRLLPLARAAGRPVRPGDHPERPGLCLSAMTRLANQNLAEVDPEPWVEFLLYSHPALSKRIAMAQEYQEPA